MKASRPTILPLMGSLIITSCATRLPIPDGRLKKAFTLVELLMVIAILSLLLVIVVPITNGVVQANQISMATQTVVDQLNSARQNAIAKNRVVEVLFYKFSLAERLDEAPRVVAMQTFIFDETNTASIPLGEIQYLPGGAVISDDDELSSVIQSAREKSTWTQDDPKRELPRGVGSEYTAYQIRFRPDGATDLGAGNWYLTVHGNESSESPPPNHATIHLDAYNGSLRLYRPG